MKTTGQKARITTTIIDGEPPRHLTVDVVSIDGDTLGWTRDGEWLSHTRKNSTHTTWVLVDDIQPENPRQLAASLTGIAATVELVESYSSDTINLDGTVDTEALEHLQFGAVLEMLTRLDAIANSSATDYGQGALIDDLYWLIESTQTRAAQLAKVIRLAVAAPAAREGN